MRWGLLPVAALIGLSPALAQSPQEDRDRGFLTALIEDNLEAPGLSVRIDGFEGALSSRATLDRLIVSDDEGPWLRLEDVTLSWDRSALLRGRLEVQELTAALIQLDRAPLPPEGVDLPDAGAGSGLALPDLPVSIEIDRIAADQINVGAPILGQDLSFSLAARASLIEGVADVAIQADRLDGPAGQFEITGAFNQATEALTINVALEEEENGIAATLLALPGAPAIGLTIAGDGTLADFRADIALASDGEDRLGGTFTLGREDEAETFALDLQGDVTSLFAPRYQAFFGPDVRLALAGAHTADGLDLETLSIETEALNATGRARLDPAGWPTLLDLEMRVAAEDGDLVLLPTADVITLRRADLRLRHDAAEGEDWQMQLTALDVTHPAASLDSATLQAQGLLERTGETVTAATGDLSSAIQGLGVIDPALQRALGAQINLDATVAWRQNAPIEVSEMALIAGDMTLRGDATFDPSEGDLPLDLTLLADIPTLSNLSALAGLDGLAGQANVTLDASLSPVRGAFDVTLDGETQDLALGIPQADALVGGAGDLTLSARRTQSGTFLEAVRLQTSQVTITGDGRILAQDAPERREGQRGEADLNLDIANGEGIDPRLAGPVSARVSLGEDAQGAWTGNARIDAPQDVTLQAAGQLTGATPDVAFDARVPRLDAFVDGLPGALIADGRAFARDGVWSVDAELQGPWATTLQIDGPVTGQRPDIAFSLRLPDVTAPVPALASVPQLQGAGSITGDLVQEGGAWVIDAQAMLPADITSRVRGPVTGPAPRLAIAATLADVAVFVPQLSGPLSIDADLAQAGEAWVASARATGPANTRATVDTVLTASPLAAEFTLQAPRVAAFAPGVPGGLDIAGTATLADTGPQVTFSGTGPYNAALSATATLPDTGATVAAQAALPNGAPLAAPLAGPLRITVDAQQTGAAWRADVRANGPFGSQAEVSGTVAGAPLDVTVSAALPNIAAFVPDISGPLAVSGRVSQPGDAYALDLEIAGPSGTTADVTGTVSGGANLDLGITGSAPLGLANGILAPRRLGGQANFNLRLSGAPQLSNLTGTVSTTGAEVSLPTLRNGLDGVNATVTLGQGRAQVDAQAGLRSGGNVTIQGPVDLSAPFNGNLAVNFGVTLVDPTLYEAQLSGALQLAGPLANGARISGDITVDSADIAVPSSGLTAIGDLPPITHLNTPRPVQRTLARAGQTDNGGDRPAERSGPAYGLDLRILAPNRIFVRGRGVDAELGGALGLRGTTAAPITTGGFELVRGRLDILQQRFNFDEGEITFQGSLVPNIRLVAVTEADALTASIIVEGPADDITVRFESAPSVPQEEILAQVFFGRDLSQLSPLQALQLANSVAVLAGRGSGGLLERLRGSTGLDDLDVTTDSEGNTAVRAGKYISDNVYTDVQIDQDGDASVSLNLDLTPNLTVRGSTGASGESSVGIFFERDY